MLNIIVAAIAFLLLKRVLVSLANKRRFEAEYKYILEKHLKNIGNLRDDPNIIYLDESDEKIIARKVFNLYGEYTKEDVMVIFRGAVKECHPDKKGEVEAYLELVRCKNILLEN